MEGVEQDYSRIGQVNRGKSLLTICPDYWGHNHQIPDHPVSSTGRQMRAHDCPGILPPAVWAWGWLESKMVWHRLMSEGVEKHA